MPHKAKLLAFEKGADGVFSRSGSLDALWIEAEALGKVDVASRIFGRGYRATVHFATKSGTDIFARGEGLRPQDALSAAIDEARSLGAGA